MSPLRALLAAAALLGASPAFGVQQPEGLAPYQLVRSLELVQDRIADGDHAALPMQRKILEMIDARFRSLGSQDFQDARNLTALLVYAMSGGNPVTVDVALSKLPADDPNRRLGAGILSYLRGQPKAAQTALGSHDPLALAPELGAYVALVKGSTLSAEKPDVAIKLLDMARLLGPGTLVEEAALRRSIAISASLADPKRFMLSSGQYARGFIRSPYASQFADAFVEGVIALHTRIDLDELAGVASLMDPERERVIYLRIARRAAIEGFVALSAFAATKAGNSAAGEEQMADPRALLYSNLASITSGTTDDVVSGLAGIDRNRLSSSDRLLLDAAKAVAAELTAKPRQIAIDTPPPAAPEEPEALPQPVRQVFATPAEPPKPKATPVVVASDAAQPPPDPTEILIGATRGRLADIDKLLAEAAE